MKPRHALLIASAILTFSLATNHSHATNVYKWTDDNGVIHYGDKRPEGAKTETLRVESRSSAPRTSPIDQLDTIKEQQEKEDLAKQEQQAGDKVKEQQKLRCSQAKNNLQTIENNSRIRIEENGELRYMTPEEINAKKEEMNKIIEDACS
ncbi:DUF4124 domain-containing protein [Alkalimarinus alittae]|uniref:DUF4124 domain-containing protein n=1 Tax=Alkalimarinus alittae TaxID=2961619 RepID=A0ABY6N0N0_9ALTE|nr:DUF4124 domain-containing protein [Alkalimarinus alittae]UZE95590.1 DUF4124 domain-containing protein [Alkalimarinus alittae]